MPAPVWALLSFTVPPLISTELFKFPYPSYTSSDATTAIPPPMLVALFPEIVPPFITKEEPPETNAPPPTPVNHVEGRYLLASESA